MNIRRRLKGGAIAVIIVRNDTADRLTRTCFRRTSQPFAGNFLEWRSVQELFSDSEVVEYFLEELDHTWTSKNLGTNSVTISISRIIGWESTDELNKYKIDDLESFQPNLKSQALRVKKALINIFSPQTSDLTIVHELKHERGDPVAIIHSIYPGQDIGELSGDITERERRIFFDWSHPGQPLTGDL